MFASYTFITALWVIVLVFNSMSSW